MRVKSPPPSLLRRPSVLLLVLAGLLVVAGESTSEWISLSSDFDPEFESESESEGLNRNPRSDGGVLLLRVAAMVAAKEVPFPW